MPRIWRTGNTLVNTQYLYYTGSTRGIHINARVLTLSRASTKGKDKDPSLPKQYTRDFPYYCGAHITSPYS